MFKDFTSHSIKNSTEKLFKRYYPTCKKEKISQLSIKLKKKNQDVIISFILCVKEVQLKCVSRTIFT